jgi:hypothetical protein
MSAPTAQESFGQVRGYIIVDEYGGTRASGGTIEIAKQNYIDEHNKSVDASPLLEQFKMKKLSTWAEADALGMCVAEVHWKYVEGWKIRAFTKPT